MASKKQEEAPQIVPMNEAPVKAPEIYVTPEMRQAIDVMIQALNIAQSKGVFTFKDASVISNAIDVMAPFGLN
jgi:hypothetical protein